MALADSFLGAFNAAANKRSDQERMGLLRQQHLLDVDRVGLAKRQFGHQMSQDELAQQNWVASHALATAEDTRRQREVDDKFSNRVAISVPPIGAPRQGLSGVHSVPSTTPARTIPRFDQNGIDLGLNRPNADVPEGVYQAMDSAGITDPTERAAFLATMHHESAGFKSMDEIGGGAQYEGRADLGNTQEGDGERYKGRGFVQLTGRDNYRRFGQLIGVDLENKPELASDPEIASQIATAYWQQRVDPDSARAGDMTRVTKAVNGGLNGIDDRKRLFEQYSNGNAPMTPAPKPVGMLSAMLENTIGPAQTIQMSPSEYNDWMRNDLQQRAYNDEREKERIAAEAEAARKARFNELMKSSMSPQENDYSLMTEGPGKFFGQEVMQGHNRKQAESLLNRAMQANRGIDINNDGVLSDNELFSREDYADPFMASMIRSRVYGTGITDLQNDLVQDPTGRNKMRNVFSEDDISQISTRLEQILERNGIAGANLGAGEASRLLISQMMNQRAAAAAMASGGGLE